MPFWKRVPGAFKKEKPSPELEGEQSRDLGNTPDPYICKCDFCGERFGSQRNGETLRHENLVNYGLNAVLCGYDEQMCQQDADYLARVISAVTAGFRKRGKV